MYLSTALTKKKSTVKDIAVYSDRDAAMNKNELPEALYEFKHLEQLYLSCQFNSISNQIEDLQKLTRLTLSSKNLTSIPKEIGKLQGLEHLSIQAPITFIPKEIGHLKKLKSFYINHTHLERLPDLLKALPSLERLVINKNIYLKDISVLADCRQPTFHSLSIYNDLSSEQILPVCSIASLKNLWLDNNQLTYLPNEIVCLKKLQKLSIGNNKLTQLPKVICQLSQLVDIRFHLNQIKQFPSVLIKMSQLKKVVWKDNSFGKVCKEILLFPPSVINPYTNAAARRKFDVFIQTIKALKFSDKQLKLFFHLQNNQPLVPNHYTRADFIAVATFPDRLFASSAIEKMVLYQQSQLDNTPLDKGAFLTVLGKVGMSKKKIKSTLKENGINYQTKVDQNTTHILIGTSIKNYLPLLDYTKTCLISEQLFQQYVNDWTQPYLLQAENKQSLEHIATLLLSQDYNNQALGIELLKGGGVPNDLLTELFIVYKFCKDKKTAQKARNLVKRNASATLLDKLKLRIPLGSIKDKYLTANKIEQLTTGTELSPWKIAQYAYRFDNKVWKDTAPLGLKNAPNEAAKKFLAEVITEETTLYNGQFSFDKKWFPYSDLLFAPEHAIQTLSVDKASIPAQVAQLESLKSLVVYRHQNTNALPDNLNEMPKLESIYFLSCTYSNWSAIVDKIKLIPHLSTLRLNCSILQQLPDNITTLQNITTLFLTTCIDAVSLQKIAKLKQLKKLHCQTSAGDLNDDFLILKNIKELCFEQDNTNPYVVTPNIGQMTNLKILKLKGAVKIPDEINQLKQLEELDIHFTYKRPHPLKAHQINQLSNLKRLRISGELEDYEKVLPLLANLEYLELPYGKYQNKILLDLLMQLPNLKTFRRFLNPQDLALFKTKYPHITFIPQ